MAVSSIRSTVRLAGGARMPMMGLGLTQGDDDSVVERAVAHALATGYRLIDTASVYENEAAIGRAIRESALPRPDIFVTTKVWNSDLGYDATLRAFDRSLELLGLDYVDMYMIHWPLIRLRRESWRALTEIALGPRCRAIGVCNFAVRHLEEIIQETGQAPMVNQIEVNPFLKQAKLVEWCRRKEILVQTHTPVSRFARRKGRVVRKVSDRYGRSVTQVLIRWALQSDVSVLVRSLDPAQIEHSAQVFDFDIALPDMDALNTINANLRVGWDPTNAP